MYFVSAQRVHLNYIDVPFQGADPPGWLVKESDHRDQYFLTRLDAIRHGTSQAFLHGPSARLSLQGEDGFWRVFDHAGGAIL